VRSSWDVLCRSGVKRHSVELSIRSQGRGLRISNTAEPCEVHVPEYPRIYTAALFKQSSDCFRDLVLVKTQSRGVSCVSMCKLISPRMDLNSITC
jgi:hypothetical protein